MIGDDIVRRQAIDLFNLVWTLLRKTERTQDEDDAMLHAAHASRFHWGEVGEPVNGVRGEWQCSHVYSVLGRSEPALHHAGRCIELCLTYGIADFDLAYAYEAVARAMKVAGFEEDAARYVELAREAADGIAKPEDRDHFLEDLATV